MSNDRYWIRTTGQTGAGSPASSIPVTPTGDVAATNVQGAIAELASEKQTAAQVLAAISPYASLITGHLADTSDAHDASAISVLDTAGNYTATDVEAVLAELPSRFAPAVFTVDSYLPAGVTPSTATSAQTLAAYNSARDAAFAVGGTVKFTPGRTYQIDDTFIVKSAMTFDCSGATLKKRSTTGYKTPLIVNEDWAAGNTDITVIAHGSVWDFNGRVLVTGTGRPYGGLEDCVHFQNCDRLRIIGRPFIKDAGKYALAVGNADDIEIDGAIFDTRSDGFHGYGPMRRAKFGTFSGRTGDDFFALTISDYDTRVANLTANGETVTEGDFLDITIEALLIDNSAVPTGGSTTGSGFALLGGSASYEFSRIKVGLIAGATKQAMRIMNDNDLDNTQVGTVTIGKIDTVGIGGSNTQIQISPTNADTITIGELCGEYANNALVTVSAGTTRVLNIGALTHNGGSTGILVHLASGGVLESLNIDKAVVILGSAGRLVQSNQTGTVPRVNVSNFDISGTNGWALNVETGAVGVRSRWSNGSFRQLNKTISHKGGTNVVMLDNVEFDGVVMMLESTGSASTRMLAGPVRFTDSNSERYFKYDTSTFSCSGAQLRVDHTKVDTASSVRGDMFLNTNSSGLALGVVQYNGSAFTAII